MGVKHSTPGGFLKHRRAVSVFVHALLRVDLRQAQEAVFGRLAQFGFEVGGAVSDGGGTFGHVAEEAPQPAGAVGQLGIEGQGAAVVLQGQVVLTHAVMQDAAVGVGHGQGVIERQGMAEGFQGSLVALLVHQGQGDAEVGQRVIGVRFQGKLELGDGAVVLAVLQAVVAGLDMIVARRVLHHGAPVQHKRHDRHEQQQHEEADAVLPAGERLHVSLPT